MKLIHFMYQGRAQVGFLRKENDVVCLSPLLEQLALPPIKDMNHLIDRWDDELARALAPLVAKAPGDAPADHIQLLAPIPYPKRHIICLGKNYVDHAKETAGLTGSTDDLPKFPIYFNKIAQPAIGHGDLILDHEGLTDKVDYEVELALVIGKDGINIAPEDAASYIFGYTIINDISARNIQRKHMQWFKGKSLETYCPMGPAIVTADEFSWPIELDIQCAINGEVRQNSNTRKLIFDIPTILADLSKGMYLRRGDIIATGTPAGVGLGFKPFRFLNKGDRIDCSIEGIGTLTNWFGNKE